MILQVLQWLVMKMIFIMETIIEKKTGITYHILRISKGLTSILDLMLLMVTGNLITENRQGKKICMRVDILQLRAQTLEL